MKKLLCIVITMCLCILSSTAIFASEGTGVSSRPPQTYSLYGANPPDRSNQTVNLGRYDGTVVWAGSLLYTDKWVKKGGSGTTTIYIKGSFGQYSSQEDATNRKNNLINLSAGIEIVLVDKNGKKTSPKYIYTNKGEQTVSFNVPANTDYYVRFDFLTGYYHSGDFVIY